MALLALEVAGNGRRHVQVTDANEKLVRMLTRSEIIAALCGKRALMSNAA